jgi:hypothetical protein
VQARAAALPQAKLTLAAVAAEIPARSQAASTSWRGRDSAEAMAACSCLSCCLLGGTTLGTDLEAWARLPKYLQGRRW